MDSHRPRVAIDQRLVYKDVVVMLTRDRLTFDKAFAYTGDLYIGLEEIGGPFNGRIWSFPRENVQYAMGTPVEPEPK